MYYLQARWKAEGKTLQYYGLRSGKNLFRNSVLLNAKQRAVIAALRAYLPEKRALLFAPSRSAQVPCALSETACGGGVSLNGRIFSASPSESL